MKKIVFISILLLFGNARAHDLWIERKGDDYVLYSGHNYSGHEGAGFIEYSPEIVLQSECYDEMGEPAEAEKTETYPVRITADCSVVYLLTSTGYWTKTPYGTKNIPRNEAGSAIESWLSYEGVKRVDRWSDDLAGPLTSDLELIPLNNPLDLGEGDKLRLLVTFAGEPVENAIVAYDGKPRGETGEDGRINIRLRHGGFQIIQASYTRPLESEKADRVVYTTNLNFEVDTGK